MFRLTTVGCFVLWAVFTTGIVNAAEKPDTVISPLATLGKLFTALLVVLLVFWLFVRLMRQMQGVQSGMHQNLRVIATLSVGQRERVLVVQAGDSQLVLGVTPTQINTLHILEEHLQLPDHSGRSDFREKLGAAMKRQALK